MLQVDLSESRFSRPKNDTSSWVIRNSSRAQSMLHRLRDISDVTYNEEDGIVDRSYGKRWVNVRLQHKRTLSHFNPFAS